MSNPFVIDVRTVLNKTGLPEMLTIQGTTPEYLGSAMMGIPQGTPVVIDAMLSNIGTGVLVDARVSGDARGKCVRCLRDLNVPLEFSLQEMFAHSADIITGESEEESDEDEIGLIVDDTVDVTQAAIDAAGLDVPFNPVCENYGLECDDSTPPPDSVEGQENNSVDIRWAGLAEKFAQLTAEQEGNPEDNQTQGIL